MAIEIPNAFEACGLFCPIVPALDGKIAVHIPSSNGFLPFDPTTSSGAPVGGFTKTGTGAYVLGLVEAIDPLEGVAMVQVITSSADSSQNIGSSVLIIPRAAPFSFPLNGQGIGVDFFDAADAPIDGNFYCSVFRFASGPKLLP